MLNLPIEQNEGEGGEGGSFTHRQSHSRRHIDRSESELGAHERSTHKIHVHAKKGDSEIALDAKMVDISTTDVKIDIDLTDVILNILDKREAGTFKNEEQMKFRNCVTSCSDLFDFSLNVFC